MQPLPHSQDRELDATEAPLVDPGRPLGLRLLGLLGALAFVMLGLSTVLLPLLQAPPPSPLPDQRERQVG